MNTDCCSNIQTINDILFFPKSIEYAGETFMFSVWIIFKGKFCIGYKHISTRDAIISILIGENVSYGSYMTVIKVNGIDKEIETIIAEYITPKEAFNKLHEIVVTNDYNCKW